MQHKISKRLFIAVAACVLLFTALFMFYTEGYNVLSREDHTIEYLSAVFLFLTSVFFFMAFLCLKRHHPTNNKWIMFLCLILSILYFVAAGEEISWGQRLLHISTPEYLAAINDQKELNFHNINKRFFDRVLDRSTIVFVLVASVLLLRKRQVFIGIIKPDIYIICAFAITPFYRQNSHLDFYHLLYLPLLGLLLYALIRKVKAYFFPLITTFLLSFLITIIHTRYNHLFPSHNNSANEFREFLFCLCSMGYAYVIMHSLRGDRTTPKPHEALPQK